MSPFRAAAAFVFLALLAPEGLALRSAPKKKAVHSQHHKARHRHQKAHKSSSTASPVVAAAQAQKSQGIDEARFGRIQNELVEAWKHKTHMGKLRQTLEAEKKLLASQQSLLESDVDDVSNSAARQQASATEAMIKDATRLLHKSREDALKETHAALTEAFQIQKKAEHDVAESSAAIAKATKAKEEAENKIKDIAAVIHAATEEAKFFFNQEVPEVQEEKAKESKMETSSISSSAPSKMTKNSVSIAEKKQPAGPQSEQAELKKPVQQKEDSATEGKEEEPAKEAKKTDTLARNQEPAKPQPQPKQAKPKQQVQKKDDSAKEVDEEEAVKEATQTATLVENQEPAKPQPKQVELKKEAQTNEAVAADEEKVVRMLDDEVGEGKGED